MQTSLASATANGLKAAARSKLTVTVSISQRRNLQDITITRTGKPIIRVQGGRYAIEATQYNLLLIGFYTNSYDSIDHLLEVFVPVNNR